MEITAISTYDDNEINGANNPNTGHWYGKGLVTDETKTGESFLARTALQNYNHREASLKEYTIAPMSGSANISVEKDSDGNASATVEIGHTSEDGKVTVSGEVSIDQDGKVSGEASIGVSWDRD